MMSGTDRIRYTVMVRDSHGGIALFGVFFERDQAEGIADRWHRALNGATDPADPAFLMVEVLIIDAYTATRRIHWFGR